MVEKKTEIKPSEYKICLDDIDSAIRSIIGYIEVKNYKFAIDTINFAFARFDKYMPQERRKILKSQSVYCYCFLKNFAKAFIAFEAMSGIQLSGDNWVAMDIEGLNLLGNLAMEQKKYDNAIGLFHQIIEHKGASFINKYGAISNVGYCYIQSNRVKEGIPLIEGVIKKILALPLKERQQTSNLEFLNDNITNYCLANCYVTGNITELTQQIKRYAPSIPKCELKDFEGDETYPDATKPRLAFISGNLMNHSVMHFVWHLLTREYKDFHVFIISYNTPEHQINPITAQLRKLYGNGFVDLSLMRTHIDYCAMMIKKMKLNIIVDLDGFTCNNPNLLLVHQLAPIQINYCGFPSYMMAPWIQYRISDDTVDNPTEQSNLNGAEKICSMGKYGFLCFNHQNAPKEMKIDIKNENEKKNIGIFCRMEKINETSIQVWNEIFSKLNGYNIVIGYGITTSDDNPQEVKLLTDKLKFGNNTHRILKTMKDDAVYYQQFTGITLLLDTLGGYGGTTRTSQALFIGTPVITLEDHSGLNIQNPMSSMLKQCGLNEFIAQTKQEYIDKVLKFAEKPPLRDEIKRKFIAGNNIEEHGLRFESKLKELIK